MPKSLKHEKKSSTRKSESSQEPGTTRGSCSYGITARTVAGSLTNEGSKLLVKRSKCLVFFFQGGKLRCKNYLTGGEVEALPILVSILARLGRWRSLNQIDRLFPEFSSASIRRCLRKLVTLTTVMVRGSLQSEREAELCTGWETWGVEARFFHFATKNVHSSPLTIDEARFNSALKRRKPPPVRVKKYPGRPRVHLPDTSQRLRGQFPEVLLTRRTHRSFGRGAVSLDQLSVLLRLTWGFTNYIRWPGLGRLPVKTSPSGGARHSLEVYMWCLRVTGLTPGIYHYRADRHELESVRPGKVNGRVGILCGYQKWVGNCAALFVMTSVLARVMWRYQDSRAYRVILLEAGHFCQTFCLVATWLGLAPFCTAALYDEKIESDLDLNADEAVLYAAGVGMPAP
jgi:SagB-type dehydrogenase family enzyme